MQDNPPASGTAAALEAALGYRFKDPALLHQALVHRSYSHEKGEEKNNEPLEFLGDAVLGFLVAELIVRRRPELSEGAMTRLRAALVNTRYLAKLGLDMGLGSCLLLGRGEDSSGGRAKPSLLADGVEAQIGAIFLDGGIRPVRSFVRRTFAGQIDAADAKKGRALDPKTALQEYVQARGWPLPVYETVEALGPDHARHFVIAVHVQGHEQARGRGSSKKRAEQDAARDALEALKKARRKRS